MSHVEIHNSDCIAGMHQKLNPASVDLIVTSIPFEELFTYSGKLEDVGNNGSTVDLRQGRFALNMRFVIQGMMRVLKPGCNACIHIQQLLAYKNQHGFIGRRDFRGAMIDLFSLHGFEWKGEAVIPKNPQAMAQRLKLHCLQFATGKRNGRDLAMAPNDYVLVFQKPGDAKPAPCLLDGAENPDGWITTEDWIKWASGTWDDIAEMDVIGGRGEAKEHDHEKHVCPLQLDVIRRCLLLYTAPGETVLDPFMGIGSTACVAIEHGRNAIGFELKESYYAASLDNVENKRAKIEEDRHDLFTMAAEREVAA